MSAETLITMRQAVQLSNLSANHLRVLLRAGKISGRKFGETWQINRSSLLAYIRKSETMGAKRGPKSGD